MADFGTRISTTVRFIWHGNDMLVDSADRAYVGNFGFDYEEFLQVHGIEGLLGEPGPTSTVICMIDCDQSVADKTDGKIEMVEVAIPHAGTP